MKKTLTTLAIATLLATPITAFADQLRGGFVSLGDGSLVVGGTTVGVNETFSVGSDVRWVDDAGVVVDSKTVTVGRPVSVYYAPGETRRVERIVVHKAD